MRKTCNWLAIAFAAMATVGCGSRGIPVDRTLDGAVMTGGVVGGADVAGSGGAGLESGGGGGSAPAASSGATGGSGQIADGGTGGIFGTGGVIGTGGIIGTGGVIDTGGVIGTGGIIGTGGVIDTGGIKGTGGTICIASGTNECMDAGHGSGGTLGTGSSGAGGETGCGGCFVTTYSGCSYVGAIDRIVIAKYTDFPSICVTLVLRDAGSTNTLGLTITASSGTWNVESAAMWPTSAGACMVRFPPAGAVNATSGSGTVTLQGSLGAMTVTASLGLTFPVGDSGASQVQSMLTASVISTGNGC
jgi:hypothetical protein